MSAEQPHPIDYSTRGAVADIGAAVAATLLIVTSGMNALQGVAAIVNDELYAAGSDYLYKFDMTAWGTVHLILGALGVAIGIGVYLQTSWAQVAGMIVAGLSILTNFAFLPNYPLWSIVIIAFNGFVIWALSVQLRGYDY